MMMGEVRDLLGAKVVEVDEWESRNGLEARLRITFDDGRVLVVQADADEGSYWVIGPPRELKEA